MASRVHVYSEWLIYASVCAPNEMAPEEVLADVNENHGSGVGAWSLSDEPTFSGGQPNPCPCGQDPGRTHYLINC